VLSKNFGRRRAANEFALKTIEDLELIGMLEGRPMFRFSESAYKLAGIRVYLAYAR
jgi:hypothetical protein